MGINDTKKLIDQLRQIQADFYATFSVTDIITNSKIFELLIADSLNQDLIPGHSGSRDAKDKEGSEFEYKHFKETSSNHSWTFNDFSDTTIQKLEKVRSVIFAHINDKDVPFPVFDWYYEVPGTVISKYLAQATQEIRNSRKMINVSSRQIENTFQLTKKFTNGECTGPYSIWIKKIINTILQIEKEVETTGILTSNKFWEVLVALQLGHTVKSEQSKHDAVDSLGNFYEYKVSKQTTWSFQDISDEVLEKYKSNKSIILASVDKDSFVVKAIYEADTKKIIKLLKKKLKDKKKRYETQGKQVRRSQASVSLKDLKSINASVVFSL